MHGSRTLGHSSTEAGSVAPVAVALAVLAAFATAYWRSLAELAARWSDPEGSTSHGFVIAAIVPLLVWLQRDRLCDDRRGRAGAAAVLVAATALHAVGHAAAIDLLAWSMLPPILWAGVALALGASAARALAVPIGFLWFAIPFWSLAAPPLQRLTAWGASLLLATVGTRAHIEGDFVTVPAGRFEIAGGCSGVSYLVVALATAAAIGVAERAGVRRGAVLAALAAGLAVLANWIRVAVVIYVGDASGMRSPLVADHESFGWWVFAGAMALYALAVRRVLRGHAPPVRSNTADWGMPLGRAATVTVVAGVAFALGPIWALAIDRGRIPPVRHAALPSVPGWSGPSAPSADWQPVFPGAATEMRATYRRGASIVDAYVAAYGVQGPGRKLVGHDSSIAGTWDTVATAPSEPRGAWTELRVRRHGDERLVWSWYEVDGRRVSEPRAVKARQALAAFGSTGAAGVVGLSARCVPDCAAARQMLREAHAAGLQMLSPGTTH